MLEQFYNFYTTLYHLTVAPIGVMPAGWVFAGVLLIGGGLFYYCARRSAPFLFWISVILILIPLLFLEIGVIIVVICWIAQASRFPFEPSSITIQLLMISLINFIIFKYAFVAIKRSVERGTLALSSWIKMINIIINKAGVDCILGFAAAMICAVLTA